MPWHKECADEGKKLETCHQCHKPLSGKVIRALDNPYHLGCFTCHHCRAAIEGPFVTNEGRPFHKQCAPGGGAAGAGALGASKGPCAGCSKDVRVGEPAVRLASGALYHTSCFTCGGCHKAFAQGEKYVEHGGAHFHGHCSPKAARCHECGLLIEEDHVMLGTHHFHYRCCVCAVCGKPADEKMVVLGGKSYHIACSAGSQTDD